MVILERISRKFLILLSSFQEKSLPLGDVVTILRYLDPRLVLFTEETQQMQVIRQLVDLACNEGWIKDKDHFYQAVVDREKMVSTGIGLGVAIPHAKVPSESDFFIAMGIHKGSGIEWKSLDRAPVQLVFLVGGPSNQHKTYLKILSHLTHLIKESSLKEDLLKATSQEQVIDFFKNHDF